MTHTAEVTFLHADGTESTHDVPEDALRVEMTHDGAVYGILDLAIHYATTTALYAYIEEAHHAPR